MYLWLILTLIFVGCVAFSLAGGLWTNTLVFVNLVMSGLIAFNYFEPLASWLDTQDHSYTYLWDFLSLWLIFAVSMGLLRTATDLLSKVKVKFKRPVEQIGGIVMGCAIGGVMVAFILATLHTAPLAREFLFGNFTPDQRMYMGLAPDRKWLGFVSQASKGAFYHRNFPFGGTKDFVDRYADRRSAFESEKETRVLSGS